MRKDNGNFQEAIISTTGPAAVTRNLKPLFPASESASQWHLAVLDRYYTTLVITLQLLSMKFYVAETIRTDRVGFDKTLVAPNKKRPADVERGSFEWSRAVDVPPLMLTKWFDSKPVYFISTGSSAREAVVQRRMGVEDVHGLLREHWVFVQVIFFLFFL